MFTNIFSVPHSHVAPRLLPALVNKKIFHAFLQERNFAASCAAVVCSLDSTVLVIEFSALP